MIIHLRNRMAKGNWLLHLFVEKLNPSKEMYTPIVHYTRYQGLRAPLLTLEGRFWVDMVFEYEFWDSIECIPRKDIIYVRQ